MLHPAHLTLMLPFEHEPNTLHTEKEEVLDHCGLLAVLASEDTQLFPLIYPALQLLQTRGYDGAGVCAVTASEHVMEVRGVGKISDVFAAEKMSTHFLNSWEAYLWMLQVRYGTSGEAVVGNAQPLWCEHVSGERALVIHNGQFFESPEERETFLSDTHAFVERLANTPGESWADRIHACLLNERGAFSLVIAPVGAEKELFLARDSRGIRPLAYGMSNSGEWVAASETSALKQLGVEDVQFVAAGEILRLTADGEEIVGWLPMETPAHCSFESVYIMDGGSLAQTPVERDVYAHRYQTGIMLAMQEMADPLGLRPEDIDMVMGIPGTGIAGGEGYAAWMGAEYVQAIVDSREDNERTFMQSDLGSILQKVLGHFNFDADAIRGKRVVLVDDSLVRGNVSLGLVRLLKEVYGATEVHFRVVCPMITNTCHLGVNTRRQEELLAFQKLYDISAMRDAIAADSLRFLNGEGLSMVLGNTDTGNGLCMGCMVGFEHPV